MTASKTIVRTVLGAALLLGGAGVAVAQPNKLPSPVPVGKISAPATQGPPGVQVTPVAKEPPPPWTGESGSSGHPEMQASAIRAAAARFESCVEELWPLAAKRNISRASFEKFTKGLTPDLRIMDFVDAQPEFTKAFWDYLDILVSDARIADGREILARYKAIFDKVEKQYGVDRHIITAIWGVEFELRHARRRPPGAALDRDAGLRRPPPVLFPRRVSVRVGNPASRRPQARAIGRLVGRRVRSDPVHADIVQEIRGRRRRRRPPRRRRQRRRPDRLDRQQPEEGRLGAGRDLGLRGRRSEGLQLSAGRPQAAAHHRRVGRPRHQARRRQAVSASAGESLSAGAGRQCGSGLPDAAQLQRHHEIQSGRGVRDGDRPSRATGCAAAIHSCSHGRARSRC